MTGRRALGRQFGWLWTAYAVSAYGSGVGFGAFPLIAILVLHAGPAEVSLLAAAGLAAGAVVAIPLGPWVEFRRKRPVMVAMDLTRFGALISIPAAFALGWLSFAQLLVVSVIVAAAKIAFGAASGAYLKALVRPEDLLVANGRFESTTWTAVELGLITCMGVFNPVFATCRLDQTPADRVARTLSAWSVTSNATIAALTALWGLLASITSPRTAIAIAGLLILATPLLLPRHDHTPQHERELARSPT
jgi:MFS family permease